MTTPAPVRILLAVASPSLVRVIEHLLRDVPGVEIAISPNAAAVLADTARLTPDVIVTSVRFFDHRCVSAAELRRLSPTSKLILITAGPEWWIENGRRPGPADAALDEEDLVRGLVPIVHALAPN